MIQLLVDTLRRRESRQQMRLAQSWLVVALVLLSISCLRLADKIVAAQEPDDATSDLEPSLPSLEGHADFDDNDDDWDRIFEEQRRLDVAIEAESVEEGDGQPVARVLEEVIPGLPGVNLRAFNLEFAQKRTLERVVDWAYDHVAARSSYEDSFVHAEDLYDLLLKTLNPLDDSIDAEHERLLVEAARNLRDEQGLVEDEMVIYRGFITRGSPLRFLLDLAHRMHEASHRRLEEL